MNPNKTKRISQNELGYLTTPSSTPKGRPLDDNIRNEIVQLRLSGSTYSEIAHALHVSNSTVAAVLKQSF